MTKHCVLRVSECKRSELAPPSSLINPLNANLLALLGAHHILHVSRIRVKKAEI
jgi:hypothetical protein